MGIRSQLKELLEYIDDIERKLDYTRFHIRNNIKMFSPEELECMALDGIIDPKDIPVDKRTEFIIQLIKNEVKEK